MPTPDLTGLLDDYIRAQPNRALGGVRALSGFEYQIRAYVADFAQALRLPTGYSKPVKASHMRWRPCPTTPGKMAT